jgi:hypothetical protein
MTRDQAENKAKEYVDKVSDGRGDRFLHEGWAKFYKSGYVEGRNNAIDELVKALDHSGYHDYTWYEHLRKQILSFKI